MLIYIYIATPVIQFVSILFPPLRYFEDELGTLFIPFPKYHQHCFAIYSKPITKSGTIRLRGMNSTRI